MGLVLLCMSGGSSCPFLFPNLSKISSAAATAAHAGASQLPAVQSCSVEGGQSKHAVSRLFILCWGKGFFYFRHALCYSAMTRELVSNKVIPKSAKKKSS